MRQVTFILVLLSFAACRSKRHIGEEYPFQGGFHMIRWGAPASSVDSLVLSDSTWKKISKIENSSTNGEIIVVKAKQREYYLEFDDHDRFFSMNYLSDKDDLDTVNSRLKRYYGEPDRSEKASGNYQQQTWSIDADSVLLEIQLLVTHEHYALRVQNKKF